MWLPVSEGEVPAELKPLQHGLLDVADYWQPE
jgi:hypothetical protein